MEPKLFNGVAQDGYESEILWLMRAMDSDSRSELLRAARAMSGIKGWPVDRTIDRINECIDTLEGVIACLDRERPILVTQLEHVEDVMISMTE